MEPSEGLAPALTRALTGSFSRVAQAQKSPALHCPQRPSLSLLRSELMMIRAAFGLLVVRDYFVVR